MNAVENILGKNRSAQIDGTLGMRRNKIKTIQKNIQNINIDIIR